MPSINTDRTPIEEYRRFAMGYFSEQNVTARAAQVDVK